MNTKPLSIRSFPNAILHIDGDAFFASCEQAMNPSLRGKPVITGLERGIVSAASYEAKALGIGRGVPLWEVKKICPEAIILPSNYEAYSIFSFRMYEIVRRYTSDVEEYSIDECFADITGLRQTLKMSYVEIGEKIKEDLCRELGMTFSIGLGPTKVLAKLGSKHKKPNGFTAISGKSAHLYLSQTPVSKIWGIGPQTTAFLEKQGIKTAYDFATKAEIWVKQNTPKPIQEIYYELRGIKILEINTEAHETYASISKTKTFTPASNDKIRVFSELSKNIENACIKLRRHNLRAKNMFVFLKTQDFSYKGIEIELPVFVNTPETITNEVLRRIDEIWKKGVLYRATGISLYNLVAGGVQMDLFNLRDRAEVSEKVFAAVDLMSDKFGKHSVYLASSFFAVAGKRGVNFRNAKPERYETGLLPGESKRRHLSVPIIGEVL